MTRKGFVIAVDGPAGAGKSSTSRQVAERLGYGYVDSGALYRCVALAALEAGTALDDAEALAALVASVKIEALDGGTKFLLNGQDVTGVIRIQKVSDAASKTSACPAVRESLLEWQRGAVAPPGTVVEGRDIGTVIFPDADLKVFLDADPHERARRRALEQDADAVAERVAGVERDLAKRDQRDTSRKVAPLKAAADAVVIDSTGLDLDAVVSLVVAEADKRRCRD